MKLHPLVKEALKLADKKDQRIGRENYWYITIKQLSDLLKKKDE